MAAARTTTLQDTIYLNTLQLTSSCSVCEGVYWGCVYLKRWEGHAFLLFSSIKAKAANSPTVKHGSLGLQRCRRELVVCDRSDIRRPRGGIDAS